MKVAFETRGPVEEPYLMLNEEQGGPPPRFL